MCSTVCAQTESAAPAIECRWREYKALCPSIESAPLVTGQAAGTGAGAGAAAAAGGVEGGTNAGPATVVNPNVNASSPGRPDGNEPMLAPSKNTNGLVRRSSCEPQNSVQALDDLQQYLNLLTKRHADYCSSQGVPALIPKAGSPSSKQRSATPAALAEGTTDGGLGVADLAGQHDVPGRLSRPNRRVRLFYFTDYATACRQAEQAAEAAKASKRSGQQVGSPMDTAAVPVPGTAADGRIMMAVDGEEPPSPTLPAPVAGEEGHAATPAPQLLQQGVIPGTGLGSGPARLGTRTRRRSGLGQNDLLYVDPSTHVETVSGEGLMKLSYGWADKQSTFEVL